MLMSWGVGYVVGGCNVQCSRYTEHGRYGRSCLYAETVECMSSAGSELCCKILLLLNMADMDQRKTVE